MNKGTLSFSLDGEYLGVAFEDEELKKGPIYPAISLLNIAGCTLITDKPASASFFTWIILIVNKQFTHIIFSSLKWSDFLFQYLNLRNFECFLYLLC